MLPTDVPTDANLLGLLFKMFQEHDPEKILLVKPQHPTQKMTDRVIAQTHQDRLIECKVFYFTNIFAFFSFLVLLLWIFSAFGSREIIRFYTSRFGTRENGAFVCYSSAFYSSFPASGSITITFILNGFKRC